MTNCGGGAQGFRKSEGTVRSLGADWSLNANFGDGVGVALYDPAGN
jgi:hypothetical protein